MYNGRLPGDTARCQLDLASRSIDLVTVATRAYGPLATVATELVRWLERERIDNESFVFTMSLALDFAQPNDKGAVVLRQLEARAAFIYGLVELVIPGALGRSILADARLRWVATTEAAILKYHNLSYAAEALCQLFLARTIDPQDSMRLVFKSRAHPVVNKVVESIALHVVNMGGGIDPLPACLEEIPKHYLPADTLVEAIYSIQKITSSEILVKMDYCAIDLLAWIYNHWSGTLCVSRDTRYVFQESMGEDSRTLTFMITGDCTQLTDCNDQDHVGTLWVGTWHESIFQAHRKVYEGMTDPGIAPNPVYRSALYEIQNPYVTRFLQLSQSEVHIANRYAQQIVRSIVELPVKPKGTWDLLLEVNETGDRMFKWWVARTPTILQRNLGGDPIARPLFEFSSRNVVDVDTENDTEWGTLSYDDNDTDRPLKGILTLYPEIADAMKLASQRCQCGCESPSQGLDEGCLQTTMFSEVMLLVGHAMAESAGASDISNLRGSESSQAVINATETLLRSIAVEGVIKWDTWFRLASSAISGLPEDLGKLEQDEFVSTSAALICWVAGSMTIVPKWFALDHHLDLDGSWSVVTLTGAVVGVNADEAVVDIQKVNTAKLPPEDIPELQTLFDIGDSEGPAGISVVSCVLAHLGNMLYRSMTVARTSHSIRVIDPSQVYLGLMRALRPPRCSHPNSAREVRPWTLDQVVRSWPPNNPAVPIGPGVHVALVDHSALEQNIAVGLADGSCVLQTRGCCFACLVDTAAKEPGFVAICCHGNKKPQRKGLKLTY